MGGVFFLLKGISGLDVKNYFWGKNNLLTLFLIIVGRTSEFFSHNTSNTGVHCVTTPCGNGIQY